MVVGRESVRPKRPFPSFQIIATGSSPEFGPIGLYPPDPLDPYSLAQGRPIDGLFAGVANGVNGSIRQRGGLFAAARDDKGVREFSERFGFRG